MILYRLDGCAPTPLAHYLKALGVLRLVAEQLDPEARGWWEGERFLLASHKDEDELLAFFLKDYTPSVMLSPWNGGSGFFRTWDARRKELRKSKNGAALARLLEHESARWQPLRDAYAVACNALGSVLKAVNVDTLPAKERGRLLIVPLGDGPIFPVADKDEDKLKIQIAMSRACSNSLYFRSAIVSMGDGFGYPSLFGSGGNDGAIDFTGRFFENLILALIEAPSRSEVWLRSALFQQLARELQTGPLGKIGQFLPGGAGGANSTTGPGTQQDTLLNPWDYILMLEGALLFTAASTRRMESQAPSRAAAPFAIGGQAAGYASAAGSDESARGEQWMPLWSQPITCCELHRLLAEGRAQLGSHAAREPLDLAKAVARLGTARGIKAFQRYGYIERNGQSNLAVPLGRFVVTERPAASLACLDDLDSWLPRLRRCARDRDAPGRLKQAERCLADALFTVIQHPNEPMCWQAVLLQMADVEAIQVHGAGRKAGPIPRLRPEWARAADDGSTEIRLALALALQVGDARGGAKADGVRRHWVTLDKGRFKDTRTDRVMQGRNGRDDAIAVVARRLVEADQRGERRLPLEPGFRIAASPYDLARLLAGEVDLNRCLALARALMALDLRACVRAPPRLRSAPHHDWPDDAWLAIRLALMPSSLVDGRHAGCDPAILRRLVSGNVAGAFALARRRLRAAGIACSVRMAAGKPEQAYLYAAALVFPISRYTATNFSRRLAPASIEETAA